MSRRVGSRNRRQVGGKSGSAPGFTPASLSGLLVWNRSDQGITQSSGLVSGWADQSGNSNNFAQSDVNKRPQYSPVDADYNGHPSLFFDGVDDVLDTSAIGYGPYTVFVVCHVNGTVGYLWNRTSEYTFGNTTYSIFTAARGGAGNSAANLTAGWIVSASPKIFTRVMDGTHAGDLVRINGTNQSYSTLVGSDPGTDVVTEAFSILSGSGGTLAEVIIYNRALNSTELGQVESYATARYGLV